ESCLVRAQRTGGLAPLAKLAATRPGERYGAATTLRPQPAQIRSRHLGQCAIPHAHQRSRGREQPHQGDQAHGLRLPRLGVLLPENQGCLPRESAMNLKLRRNCRVFQERSVPQILATLLEEHGIQADTCRFRLGADYPARAYCTQYGETDLEFLHRLCAEEGLHYHFEHHADRHELVFGDNQTVFPRLQQPAPFDLNPGLNLYLPPDCARRVVHLTARDEKRWNFALNSLAPDHQEIELPGCHSDIGGGYPPLMTEKLLIGKPRPVLLYWGRSPEQSAAWRDAVAEAEQLELQGVPAGSLHIVTRPLSPSRQRLTASSERHLVLLEVERQVRGELARVYLWAMHRLASAAEVPLPSLDTTDPRLAIPADLKPIAEKLLAAVQDGVPPALSFEEERYLRARYIHLRSEEHTSELQSRENLVCRLLLEKKKK